MKEVKPKTYAKGFADRFGGLIDRAVYAFAPIAGARRIAFRQAHERHQIRNASTDAGESTQLRDGKWLGSRLSPDAGLQEDLDSLRTKSRELYRTDSIGGAIDSRVNLVVSYGFTPQARIKERDGLVTAEQADAWNAELEEIFERQAPIISKTGKQSLWQLARLIERHHGCDGESITILSDRVDPDKPIPLTLEVIDPVRLETPPGEMSNPQIRMGVEYDASGKIVAYHIRNKNPGDVIGVDHKYTRYPADRVLHVFEPWFAGQSRAYPWLTRIINRLKDAKDLDEAAIIAAQAEACYVAFITSPAGGYDGAEAAATESAGGKRYQDLIPGTFRYLDVGEDVKFGAPTRSNGYGPIMESIYRRASAGMNYPYEMVSKNWGGLSFAAGRLSLTDVKLFVKSQQKLLDEMWLSQIWNRLVFESVAVGECSIPPRLYNKARWWFQRHEWRAPSWPYALTPKEEVETTILAVDNNLETKAHAIGERGGDLEDVFPERKKERQMERDMDIEPAASKVPDAQLNPDPQTAEQQKQVAA